MAYGLALLESKDLAHPALEVLITVDEEIGLLGAEGFDCSVLKGKRLINLDSEQKEVCGSVVQAAFPVSAPSCTESGGRRSESSSKDHRTYGRTFRCRD